MSIVLKIGTITMPSGKFLNTLILEIWVSWSGVKLEIIDWIVPTLSEENPLCNILLLLKTSGIVGGGGVEGDGSGSLSLLESVSTNCPEEPSEIISPQFSNSIEGSQSPMWLESAS